MQPSGNILVVEDHEGIRTALAAALRMEGYGVWQAAHGVEALRLVAAHRPDLILLDLMLPELDGWEVARTLKADADTAGIPLLALTAQSAAEARARAFAAGFDGYLTKPSHLAELLAEIRRRISGPRG